MSTPKSIGNILVILLVCMLEISSEISDCSSNDQVRKETCPSLQNPIQLTETGQCECSSFRNCLQSSSVVPSGKDAIGACTLNSYPLSLLFDYQIDLYYYRPGCDNMAIILDQSTFGECYKINNFYFELSNRSHIRILIRNFENMDSNSRIICKITEGPLVDQDQRPDCTNSTILLLTNGSGTESPTSTNADPGTTTTSITTPSEFLQSSISTNADPGTITVSITTPNLLLNTTMSSAITTSGTINTTAAISENASDPLTSTSVSTTSASTMTSGALQVPVLRVIGGTIGAIIVLIVISIISIIVFKYRCHQYGGKDPPTMGPNRCYDVTVIRNEAYEIAGHDQSVVNHPAMSAMEQNRCYDVTVLRNEAYQTVSHIYEEVS